MNALVWFRRDLRIKDNPALYHAVKDCDTVFGVFVITPKQWKQHHDADSKVSFWLDAARMLSTELSKLGIPLLIRTCDSFEQTPRLLSKLTKEHRCERLYWNREYEVWEARRDAAVESACEGGNVEPRPFDDRVIVLPNEIATKDGRFYSVFTPYRRVWDTLAMDRCEALPKPRKQQELPCEPDPVPASVPGFDRASWRDDLWPSGEQEAHKRLKRFSQRIADYNDARDMPSLNGTSLLSPYLTAGVISPRHCLNEALAANRGKIAGKVGPTTWISELTWRDFYTHVMVGFPRVSMDLPFKRKTEALEWRSSDEDFSRWCAGMTGYPIVDAGMRQLNRTGWMHNRLRMVTAMFLTKHLLIDWRRGERYFMEKLIDGDLAANNGGWQWSASTGTDAVPYFRIFNPFGQSKRFDVDGNFIKKMCPELEPVPAAVLHDPKKLTNAIAERGIDYPGFVVDQKEGRERALAAFKALPK